MKSIHMYLDYRFFLNDYYHEAKISNPGFSYRVFAARVGVKAPNFLEWLIKGKRNLAAGTIPKVANALGLNNKEARYFGILVRFNQSKSIKEKTKLFDQLTQLRKMTKVKLLAETQYEHYRHWYSEAIRELLRYYRLDPNERYAYRWLGKALCPNISESQAKSAVKKMLELGILCSDENGIIKQADQHISTGDEVSSFLIRKYHQSMIQMAGESQDRFPREKRDVSSVTMSVSDQCFELVKKEMQQFRKRIVDIVKLDKAPCNVYQFNLQLFPLTPVMKRTSHS